MGTPSLVTWTFHRYKPGMKFSYFGHSTFSVESCGRTLLFDPFITGNPLAKGIALETLKADYILITHAHADHTGDAVKLALQTGAECLSNFEICNWLKAAGVSRTQPLNHGGTVTLDCGRVKYVSAVHSSSFADGTYGGNPGGFVVETAEGSFYYSGDTALTMDMKLIGEAFKLNFAVLCLGDHFTMGVEDAVKAARMVGVGKVVGVHFDTFPPIKIDHDWAREMFANAGLELFLLRAGDSVDLA